MVRRRIRIRFQKKGDLRLIGHRDLIRVFERMFRRAGLPLAISEGFHPKPRMTFPSALALGIRALDEVMEVELADAQISAQQILDALREQVPEGLAITRVDVRPEGAKKARVRSVAYDVQLPGDRLGELDRKIADFLSAESWQLERGEGRAPVDVRTAVECLELDGNHLHMKLRADVQGGAQPRHLLEVLGLDNLNPAACQTTRTHVELAE